MSTWHALLQGMRRASHAIKGASWGRPDSRRLSLGRHPLQAVTCVAQATALVEAACVLALLNVVVLVNMRGSDPKADLSPHPTAFPARPCLRLSRSFSMAPTIRSFLTLLLASVLSHQQTAWQSLRNLAMVPGNWVVMRR